MYKRVSVFVLLSYLVVFSTGFSQATIQGRIVDEVGEPISFANIYIVAVGDSTNFSGSYTELDGYFSSEPLAEARYALMISALGFVDTTRLVDLVENQTHQLGDIVMLTNTFTVDEVVVEAKAPIVQRLVDRLVFNVASSPSAQGENVLTMLRYVPGVIVDMDGTIRIAGKDGVRILINNKSVLVSGDQLVNMLRSMPATNVEKIELITNPSARYDAEGSAGIINIELKRTIDQGLNGDINTRVADGINTNYDYGATLNIRKGSINVFGTYSYNSFTYLNDGDVVRNYRSSALPVQFREDFYDEGTINSHYSKLGTDFYIKDKQIVGVVAEFSTAKGDNPFQSTSLVGPLSGERIDSIITIDNNTTGDFENLNLNLHYDLKVGKTESYNLFFNLDYSYFIDRDFLNYNSFFLTSDQEFLRDADRWRATNPIHVDIFSAKLDYIINDFAKGTLELGAKHSEVDTDNDITYFQYVGEDEIIDISRSNNFLFKEKISAGYFNWSRNWEGLSLQMGLRLENTDNVGNSVTLGQVNRQKYLQLFPSLFLQRSFQNKDQVSASYSRRVIRPSYSALNPFVFFYSPYSIVEGNPGLRTEIGNSFELSYAIKNTYSASLRYSTYDHVITETATQNDVTRVVTTTKENLDQQSFVRFNIFIPLSLTSWWDFRADLTYKYERYINAFPEENLENIQQSGSFYLANNFALPHDISAELTAWYTSPFINGIYRYAAMANISVGLKKSFFDDKLTVNLGVSDIFNQYRGRVSTNFANQDRTMTQFHDFRKIRLALSYNFSDGGEFSQRNRGVGNQSEQNRVR